MSFRAIRLIRDSDNNHVHQKNPTKSCSDKNGTGHSRKQIMRKRILESSNPKNPSSDNIGTWHFRNQIIR